MGLAGYGARVEGIPAVEAALASGRVRNLRVVRRSAASPRMAELLDSARGRDVEIEVVKTLEGIALTSSPQGVAADCRLLRPVTLAEMATEIEPAALVVIDHISDPRNLGAIARSAVAAGTPRLVIPQRRGSPLTATAFKAAAGALEWTRVCLVSSIAATLSQLSRMGIWTVGLAADAPTSLLGLDLLTAPTALVVGLNVGIPAMDMKGDSQEHVYLASAYAAEGLLANALRHYEQALEMEPTHEIALDDAGAVLARRGDFRRAAASWERLLHHYPDRTDVRFRLAAMSLDTGDYARAERHFEHLTAEEPGRAILHARLAQSRSHLGDLDGAAAYRRALQLDPMALPLHRQLAQLELQRCNQAAALPHVRALAQQAGEDSAIHREVEEFYRRIGRVREPAAGP